MLERILMVDDESKVLSGYELLLHKEFQIDTAVGGAAALSALEATGPYAVVVSDMHMPEMNGAQLLARIKHLAPNTIRIILTGNADIQNAVSAVNEGSIFRFLTLRQGDSGESFECGIDAVPSGHSGKGPTGKYPARQHSGTHGDTWPHQPGGLRARPPCPPLYALHSHNHGPGKSLEV